MKATLLLFGVLVCASMTEASSVRWAKNHFKAPITRGTLNTLNQEILVDKITF